MAKKNFYAVRVGRTPGIYKTWAECQQQVIGYAGASFKGFASREEAEDFMGADGVRAAGDSKQSPDKIPPAELSEQLGAAVAYVDGSYDAATQAFACGVALFWQGEEYQFSEKYEDPELSKMHNVAGEIRGAELAMRYCAEHQIPKLVIFHDYEGIAKWPMGDWQAQKEGTIEYKRVYTEYAARVAISFCKVRGHSGNEWNDLADHLARKALGLD